jgi:hypothetical protein
MISAQRVGGLLEMLLTYARAFAMLAANVEFSRGQVNGYMLQGNFNPINAQDVIGQSAIASLQQLREICAAIPILATVADPIDRTVQKINSGVLPLVLHNELEAIQNRVFDELKKLYYYPVTEQYAAVYSNAAPFGEQVYNAFPSARIDIQNAGRCIILGQGTAGVFHLMRVMEVALKVLGRDLGIPYAPSWESYIRQITNRIEEQHPKKPPKWKRKEPFYKDILADLVAIKHAWRNPTMHIVNEYSQEMATPVYTAVMVMMQRMAEEGMKERGKAVAITVALAAA